jgi:hypothetical protein
VRSIIIKQFQAKCGLADYHEEKRVLPLLEESNLVSIRKSLLSAAISTLVTDVYPASLSFLNSKMIAGDKDSE